MNITEENKQVSGIAILFNLYVLKNTDFGDSSVAEVIFLNNCNRCIWSSLLLWCPGARKLGSALKVLESSAGEGSCVGMAQVKRCHA